jgi:hypothetical protein
MAALPMIAAVASMVGAGVQAAGTIAAGKDAQKAANYEAAQIDIRAKEEQAAAQRDALEYRHKKDLALSELQSKSAASGFSATDPTTLALADEITKYGTVQEQMAMYGGTSRRTGLEAQAAGRRMEGAAARKGAAYSAAGTILGGISSMADKYRRPAYG